MAVSVSSNSETVRPQRWSQLRRLEFIDSRLRWETRINRRQLMEEFGISSQQASSDLAAYSAQAPDNLAYDRNEKVYRAGHRFKPVFDDLNAEDVLAQLQGLGSGLAPSGTTLLAWEPPTAVVRFPQRQINDEMLRTVIGAIRDSEKLFVTYQSMRRPEASQRWLAPHALGFDGMRWHARSWCFERQAFRDFVLTRIFAIHETEKSNIDAKDDARWNTMTSVLLRPRQDLSPSQRAAIAAEFGMHDDQLAVPMREAMVYYFVRQLRLDISGAGITREIPLEWVNQEELMPLVREATA